MGAIESLDLEGLQTRSEGEILWITLSEPDRANALSPSMVSGLTRIYSADLRADGFRAILLQAEGKHFSAGADLNHLRSLSDASREKNREDSERLRGLFESILRQEALTIAMVQGACVAGGCGLATAQDFVVAAENARFMYSEVKIGFVAALVASYLPLRMRGSDIREMLLNPEFVKAARALEVGMVNRVVDADDLSTAGRDLAIQILERASSESIARTKRLLLDIVGLPLDQAFGVAAEANAAARATADCRHGIATFLETKSTPDWRRR